MIPKTEILARLHAVIVQVRHAPTICGSVLVADVKAIEDALAAFEAEVARTIDDATAAGIHYRNDVRQAQRLTAPPRPLLPYQSTLTGRWGRHWGKRRAS